MFYRFILVSLLFLVTACGEEQPTPSNTADPDQPPLPLQSWCDASLGGSPGTRAFAVDFSRAHVGHTLFGPTGDWLNNDKTLATLLSQDGSVADSLLSPYANSFESVCALNANENEERNSNVSMTGTFAVITPGIDAPTIPNEATAIVIDATQLQPSDSVLRAASTAFDTSLILGSRSLREMQGFPAQEGEWTHYEARPIERPLLLEGQADTTRPLYILTGARLTPEAASVIGALKLLDKAIVVGHPVSATLAESTWTGIEDRGLLWRSSFLKTNGNAWPDFIEADHPSQTPLDLLDDLSSLSSKGPATGNTQRSPLQTYKRLLGEPEGTFERQDLRAALLISHGVFDWFYSYFDLVGHSIEQALVDSILEVDTVDDSKRLNLVHLYGRFIHHLHDGHGYYYDWGKNEFAAGDMNIQLQQVNGEPMIRQSQHTGLNAGDVITHIDGVTSEQWFEETMSRYSAATQGWRWVMASDELLSMDASMELTLRDHQGAVRTTTITPESYEGIAWGGTYRDNGRLTNLGAGHIEFVNLNAAVSGDEDLPAIISAIQSLDTSNGLILDMRDYPMIDYNEIWKCFFSGNFGQTIFDHPTWSGPNEFRYEREHWRHDAGPEVFTGPTVVMVSNKSVSSAENFSQVMVTRENVRVVGQPSAGTNGTITTIWLPGNLRVNFTGMRLLNPDETDIHGIGIVPNVVVTPTAGQFANGDDPELLKAIEWIESQL